MTSAISLKTAGERIKWARQLAGFTTRRAFEEQHSISSNTLQGWEQGKNQLSSKGAARISEALRKNGVLCTEEWLIQGEGLPPRFIDSFNLSTGEPTPEPIQNTLDLSEEQIIYQESLTFKRHNSGAMVLTVLDDTMEPYYSNGDYVGGIRTTGRNIDDYLGTPCIIELDNRLVIPRFLQKGHKRGTYILSSANPKSALGPLNLYDVPVVSVAPIIWHRRRLSTLSRVPFPYMAE